MMGCCMTNFAKEWEAKANEALKSLQDALKLNRDMETALEAANERIAQLQKLINESLKASMEGN